MLENQAKTMTETNKQLGISIQLIRQYDVDKDRFPTRCDLSFSCVYFGHTWKINLDEAFCNVCGMPNPKKMEQEDGWEG